MPEYKCARCSKIFKLRSDYDRHLNRKILCKILTPKTTELTPITTKDEKSNTVCDYCNMEFSRKDSLRRHLDGRCKKKNEYDSKMEKIMDELIKLKESNQFLASNNKKLEEELAEIKKNGIKTTNNINNGVINNVQHININLVAFGKENYENITDNQYRELFIHCKESVPKLVKYIHFNKNKPENHNIYISNIRDQYMLIFNGNEWQIIDCETGLEKLFDDNATILETKFDELMDNLNETEIKRFKRFIELKNTDDVAVKQIKRTLRMMLYNNREIVKDTRKKIQK